MESSFRQVRDVQSGGARFFSSGTLATGVYLNPGSGAWVDAERAERELLMVQLEATREQQKADRG